MVQDVRVLLERIRELVPPDSPLYTSGRLEGWVRGPVGPHFLQLRARVDARRGYHEHLLLDGARIHRLALLVLTCWETSCPHVQRMVARWLEFQALRPRAPGDDPTPHRRRWEQERCRRLARRDWQLQTLTVGAFQCEARKARFKCISVCPNQVHEPRMLERDGYDLFEDGVFVGGACHVHGGMPNPRLPTLEDARSWVSSHQRMAEDAIERVRRGGDPRRRPRGPIWDR